MSLSAIYPGTFDPLTNGHLDLIRRACQIFDRVMVVIAVNARKKPWISAEHRLALLQQLAVDWPQVTIHSHAGMMVDFAQQQQARVIIRGMRNSHDFNDEWSIANMNRTMDPLLETLFLPASDAHVGVSATIVREIAILGGNIAPFVSSHTLAQLKQWGYLTETEQKT